MLRNTKTGSIKEGLKDNYFFFLLYKNDKYTSFLTIYTFITLLTLIFILLKFYISTKYFNDFDFRK